jgi:hypothetical protein
MGVFARLLRRSKATEEAVVAEVATEQAPTAAEQPDEATAAEDAAEQAVQPEPEPDEAGEAAEPATKADLVAATESVEIPRQQSADEAADQEAGEGARK